MWTGKYSRNLDAALCIEPTSQNFPAMLLLVMLRSYRFALAVTHDSRKLSHRLSEVIPVLYNSLSIFVSWPASVSISSFPNSSSLARLHSLKLASSSSLSLSSP